MQISLLHGWLYDPSETELSGAIGRLSYNQLQDWLIQNCSGPPETLARCALVQDFLTESAGQLTRQGIARLTEHMRENQLAVFFRNNHFAVLTKEGGVRKDCFYVCKSVQSKRTPFHFITSFYTSW